MRRVPKGRHMGNLPMHANRRAERMNTILLFVRLRVLTVPADVVVSLF